MRALCRLLLGAALILSIVLSAGTASAQPEDSGSNWKVGGFSGPFLPSNYPGITEIMKAIGVRASYFDGKFGYEAFGFRSAEDGAVVNYAGGSLVKGMYLPEVTDVTVLVLGGIHLTYNRRAASDGVQYDFTRAYGIHMGGGVLLHAFGNWYFRGATTIFNGPGRTVLVELGLQYDFGAKPAAPEENQNP